MNGQANNNGLPPIPGGNDTIDFYSPQGFAGGDAWTIQGFVQCGSDVITAHDVVAAHGIYGAELIGDADQASGAGVVGGNDTITGDLGDDLIYGDFILNQNGAICGSDAITGGGG